MQPGNQFGEFLRARREHLTPEDAGLPATGQRRIQGLRREEAALLSGLSPEDYLRLEQGVEQNPTEEVLDALTRALKLDDSAAASLRDLARDVPLQQHHSRSLAGPADVPGGLADLISTWPNQVAWIEGRLTDVLSANPLALALSPRFTTGTNLVRAMFLDPASRDLYSRWDRMLVASVARLRTLIGPDIDDSALAQLVGELSVRSGEFRALWGAPELVADTDTITRLTHPLVGTLELETERLAINSTGDFGGSSDSSYLVILHARVGSESDTALRRLAATASGTSPAEAQRILPAPVPIDSKRRLQ
ncbi:helix-turn-helix transcriptional regulator [Frigoribacterium sp. CG_9.8]|uniref:helix-turn-helix transcriptional regulator n=1 Tax=Frigoribacterium sp. CG_9.8 TaxID=2787733 RepID=UPI0018C976FA|nr:helix-turn-helix transcriptional regulator [Frigoribacterium sp. CG_9.8]MBG6107118.1 transcriptional regulator with XRE-family HTH domain [Frigoribacterium sp. CG_9.8]